MKKQTSSHAVLQSLGKSNRTRGFTIVELLIVIVVIAILAAITIVAYNGIQQRARDAERVSEVKALRTAIEMYAADTGAYPSVGSDNAGYSVSSLAAALVPTYLQAIPLPPSGSNANDYSYVRGAAANASYAIRIDYQTKPACHWGQNNATTGWWSLPVCS